MERIRGKLPSPAVAISLLALFVALGGSVYARNHAHGINGKVIKVRSLPGNRLQRSSLPGNRLQKNTVTGSRINEETLGLVPNAARLEGIGAGGFARAGTGDAFHFSSSGVHVAATTQTAVGSLSVPAGQYIALATLAAQNVSTIGEPLPSTTVHCMLSGGSGSDDSELGLSGPKLTESTTDRGSLALSMATTLESAGPIRLTCALEGSQGATVLNSVKLSAIRVAGLNG